MGTRIRNLQVTKVVDGDTIKVLLNGQREFLRLHCIDTEESFSNGTKPVTQLGVASTEMAKQYFTSSNGSLVHVDIEFDSDHPLEVCLEKHRDNHGRLICYVHKGADHYNLKVIKEGWSPYYIKYGRSEEYHQQMVAAETEAQAYYRNIWNPDFNNNSASRNYNLLISWWSLRDAVIQDYRLSGRTAGVFSVRLDYPKILSAAEKNEWITIFCDLQDGITKWIGSGALIHTGSKDHILKLWVPEAKHQKNAPLVQLIQKRYAGLGRGYVYVQGQVTMYRDKPEITLTDLKQLSDFCPKNILEVVSKPTISAAEIAH